MAIKKDQTCEQWLDEIKSRPRPRKLLEYFAANIAKRQEKKSRKNSSTTTDTTTNNNNTTNNTTTTTNAATAPSSLNHLLMYCRHCNNKGAEGTARAFLAAPPPQIVFCTNRLRNAKEMEETFVHEMIHAVDYCTRDMDITKCEALACSEIRAAREAECLTKWIPNRNGEEFKVPWPITTFTKEGCTKYSAVEATQAMFPGSVGEACVEKMFQQCYYDTVPFDEEAAAARAEGNT